MTTRESPSLQNSPETAAANAFDRAVLTLRRPWWTTVAASVLLLSGAQHGANAVTVDRASGTQVWEGAGGEGLVDEVISVSGGGHLRFVASPITAPLVLRALGEEKIILLNGAQMSGVDETVPPRTIVPFVVGNSVEIGAAGGTGVVALTLGQKGDSQTFTLPSVTLQQSVAITAVSNVDATISSPTAQTVSVRGPKNLTVTVSAPEDVIDFVVEGGNLELLTNPSFVGKTVGGDIIAATLVSGKLKATGGTTALGASTNKLVLLGGELETNSAALEYDAIVGTDTAHANVTLSAGSDLGLAINEVQLKAGGASITVDTSAIATISGIIKGAGSLEKKGSGALVLANENTYSGNTILSDGEVQVYAPGNLSTSKVVFQGGALNITGTFDPSEQFAPVAAGQHVKITTGMGVTFGTPIKGQGGLKLVNDYVGNNATDLTLAPGSNPYYGSTVLDSATGTNTSKLTVSKLEDICTSSYISIGANAMLDASVNESVFKSTQGIEIKKDGTLLVQVAATMGIANRANITVQLEDVDGLGRTATGKPVNQITAVPLEDLKLKVRVAPETRGAMGLDTLLVGEKRVVVARRLTVEDYADGVAPILATTDNVQLEFLNPVFAHTNNSMTGFEVTRRDYSEFGEGTNDKAVGHYFSQHLPGTSATSSPFDAVHKAMDNADYEPEIANILKQLSPGAYAELARLQVRRAMAVADAIEDRVDSLGIRGSDSPALSMGVKNVTMPTGSTPSSKPEADTNWAAWASAYTKSTRLDASASAGLGQVRERSTGDTFGVERHAGSAVIGLFGSTSWGKSRFEDPAVDVSTDSWHIGMYTVAPLGNFTWDASLVYGMTTNDSRRDLNLPALGLAEQYRAKFDSRDVQVSTGFVYNLTAPESAFQTAPVLRLSYVNTNQSAVDEVTQNNSNNDFAAHVDAVKESSFLSKLGWKFSYATGGKDMAFSADASSYWLHDWTAAEKSTAASLKGGSGITFPVSGRKGSSDAALINAGLQVIFSERYTTRVSVNQEMGGERNETVGRATVGVKF